jgi:hypothetical protein
MFSAIILQIFNLKHHLCTEKTCYAMVNWTKWYSLEGSDQQEIHDRQIARGWLGSSTDTAHVGPTLCLGGAHTRDPRGFMRYSYRTPVRWNPHIFHLWDPQLNFLFSHLVGLWSLKLCIPNFILNYIIQYYLSDFVMLQTTTQNILFNIFRRICVPTSSKQCSQNPILHKLYIIFLQTYYLFYLHNIMM